MQSLKQNFYHSFSSQMAPHTSPSRASYVVYFVRVLEKIFPVKKKCILFATAAIPAANPSKDCPVESTLNGHIIRVLRQITLIGLLGLSLLSGWMSYHKVSRSLAVTGDRCWNTHVALRSYLDSIADRNTQYPSLASSRQRCWAVRRPSLFDLFIVNSHAVVKLPWNHVAYKYYLTHVWTLTVIF